VQVPRRMLRLVMLGVPRRMGKTAGRPEALGLWTDGRKTMEWPSGGYYCTYLSSTTERSHTTMIRLLETDTSHSSGGLLRGQCNVFSFLEADSPGNGCAVLSSLCFSIFLAEKPSRVQLCCLKW
jgi:hypothetical protein